jgi:hypothetical protein
MQLAEFVAAPRERSAEMPSGLPAHWQGTARRIFESQSEATQLLQRLGQSEAKNAAATITLMGFILATCFFGVSLLASKLEPIPQEGEETVLSMLGEAVFGAGTLPYYVLQFSTFAILILAANTAYADFPRLSSIIARDEFLPHQFKNRGARLVFSNGIVVPAAARRMR